MAEISFPVRGPAQPLPPRKRRRTTVVCSECRRKKVACDRNTPCSHCAEHNAECVYVTGAVPPPYGPPTATPSAAPSAAPSAEAVPVVAASESDPLGELYADAASPAAADGHKDWPGAPTAATTPKQAVGGQPRKPGGNGGRLAKTRFLGRSHWVSSVSEMLYLHDLLHLNKAAPQSPLSQSMRICKRIGHAVKANVRQRSLVLASASEALIEAHCTPPRAVADRLVDLYFNAYEPVFRILHMPTFRQRYRAFMDQPRASHSGSSAEDKHRSSGDLFQMQLLLVWALGSCFYDGPRAETPAGPRQNGGRDDAGRLPTFDELHDSLRAALTRAIRKLDLGGCAPLEKYQITLETLQVYCLVVLARQTTALEMGDDLTWFSVGSLLHTALGMGLNHDPSHFASLSFAEAEMRRRLWATVVELVLQASLDQGMPPLLSPDDYDCGPPHNLNDEAVGGTATAPEEGEQRPAPQPDTVFTHSTVQRLLCQSLPVRLRITKALNGMGPALDYDRALQLSRELLESCQYSTAMLYAAPLMTEPPTPAGSVNGSEPSRPGQSGSGAALPQEPTGFVRLRVALYELLTKRFHHALHNPFAREATTNMQYYYSRRARIDTSLRVLSLFRPPVSALDRLSFIRLPPAAEDAADAVPPPSSGGRLSAEQQQGRDGTTSVDRRVTTHPHVSAAADPCRRLLLVGRGLFKCTIVHFTATALHELVHQLEEAAAAGPSPSGLTLAQCELYDLIVFLVELAHARIAVAGEINIKGYFFFRAALAQIDALVAGQDVQPVVIATMQRAATPLIGVLEALAARKNVALQPKDYCCGAAEDGSGVGSGPPPGGRGSRTDAQGSGSSGNPCNMDGRCPVSPLPPTVHAADVGHDGAPEQPLLPVVGQSAASPRLFSLKGPADSTAPASIPPGATIVQNGNLADGNLLTLQESTDPSPYLHLPGIGLDSTADSSSVDDWFDDWFTESLGLTGYTLP